MSETIKQIRAQLARLSDRNDPYVLALQADGRKGVKSMCVAWTDERTGTRAKKRELEETGKHGVRRPCCKKLGAHHGKLVKTMCVA